MTEAAPGFRPSLRVDRGGCAAMRLPPDETIAHAARAGTGEALEGFALGLSADTIDNATLMASELATNALRHGVPRAPDGSPSLVHPVELWIYARAGVPGVDRSELVVKVFDGSRAWRGTAPPRPDAAPSPPSAPSVPAAAQTGAAASGATAPAQADAPPPGDAAGGAAEPLAEHGRGLLIVDALSQGRWGHHLSRSRLGDPAVSGKATWFGLPIPPVRRPLPPGGPHGGAAAAGPACTAAARAAEDLHALLVGRGIRRLIRRNERGVSVLSVRRDLTVWCAGGAFHWRVPGGGFARMPRTDLTEACEQIVEIYEALSHTREDHLDPTG